MNTYIPPMLTTERFFKKKTSVENDLNDIKSS